MKTRATTNAFIKFVGIYLLRAMFLGGSGNRLESGAPAAFANFIGIDEIVGALAALLAFKGDRARYTAHIQSAREGLPLDPLDKFHGYVAVAIRIRFFRSEKERPRAK